MLRTLLTLVPIAGFAAATLYLFGFLAPADVKRPIASAAAQPDASERADARPPHPHKPVLEQEPATSRNVTPPGMHSGPVRRAVRAQEPSIRQEPDEPQLYHRVIVTEAGLFEAGKTSVRLAGIKAPAIDETCTDSLGTIWPCGRAAAAALRKLIGNRTVECEILDEDAATLTGRCSVGRHRLGEWLVTQGWAEPAGDADFAQAGEEARAEKRGIFTAEWRRGGDPVDMPRPVGMARPPDSMAGPAISISAPPAAPSE